MKKAKRQIIEQMNNKTAKFVRMPANVRISGVYNTSPSF